MRSELVEEPDGEIEETSEADPSNVRIEKISRPFVYFFAFLNRAGDKVPHGEDFNES